MGSKRKRKQAKPDKGNEESNKNIKLDYGESKPPGLVYSNTHRLHKRLKIGDLQQLVLYLLTENNSPPAPQWIATQNRKAFERVVVLMVPGLSMDYFFPSAASEEEEPKKGLRIKGRMGPDNYYPQALNVEELSEAVKPLADIFTHVWPIQASGDEKYGKIASPVYSMLSSAVPKDERSKSAQKQSSRTPITQYLASKHDFESNDFMLHPVFDRSRQLPTGWISSNVKNLEDANVADESAEAGSITQGRNVISIDCEMCSTGINEMALSRISVVGWDGTVILDELVKPEKPIVDYLTQFSGITKQMLDGVQTTLQDIQAKLLEIVSPTTIIVGHSLESDFNALRFAHPFVVDTTLLFPHPQGLPYKQSLKFISKKYLQRDIQLQHGSSGHDSIEDAKAVMDLVKLKCENGPDFGTPDVETEALTQRLARDSSDSKNFSSAVIDWKNSKNGYFGRAGASVECDDDAQVVDAIANFMHATVPAAGKNGTSGNGNSSDKSPTFIWACLHQLEHARGWSNNEGVVNSALSDAPNPKGSSAQDNLDHVVAETANRIVNIFQSLPPKTALVLYSGTGDRRVFDYMSQLYRRFKDEYKTKKWDELSVKWSSVEDDAKRAGFRQAIEGIGMLAVRN